jgi:hypothetical protein
MHSNLPSLKLIRSKEINRILWDQSIEKTCNALPYACSWYLDAVCGDQWDALISSDYSWLIPLPYKRKMGIQYLPTPLFVQQLGVFGPDKPTPKLMESLFAYLEKTCSLVEFNINFANPIEPQDGWGFRERSNLILAIPSERSNLVKGFSENTRRNIRKAEDAQLRFGSASIRSIIKLFQDYKEAEVKHWKVEYYNVLERLYHMAAYRGFSRCFGVYNTVGEMICGAMIVEWNHRAVFVFSGNSPEGKELGAMPYLIHKYLLEAPPEITCFDFEGSDNPGLKRFYQSFGAIESNYVHLTMNRLPFYLRWLKT